MAKKTALPRYTERQGWIGGDSRTLYAFTDRRTGKVGVYPGGGGSNKKLLMHVGPEADVRIATRAEAEDLWQSPLKGWNVSEGSASHARKYGPKATEKIGKTMGEFKRGKLKSSSGQKVKSRDQAIAIAISQARRAGYKTPPDPTESHARRLSPAEMDRDIAEALGRRSHAAKRSPKSSGEPVILVREGGGGTTRYPKWRQYMVVSDGRVAIVHMKPAMLGGWNFEKVDVQEGDDWPGYSRDQIVDWKTKQDTDGKTKFADDLDPDFRQKLIAKAR